MSWQVRCFFARFFDLPHGVPSHDTFSRVFAILDTGQFLTCIHSWMDRLAGSLRGQGIALDGKTLLGSYDTAAQSSPLHLLTAYTTGTRLVLRQLKVPEGSNEIPTAGELLECLELAGAIVTADALHCQVETAKSIIAREADYVLTVKGNQPGLRDAVFQAFADHDEGTKPLAKVRRQVVGERNRGHKERRTCLVAQAPATPEFARWPGLRTIGLITRERTVGDQEQEESVFFISSLPPQVRELNQHLRDHWKIENSQHHVLDVTFTEDDSRIRKHAGPEITAAFRRLALNILQRDTSVKDNIRGKRLRAGWDEALLEQIYAAFHG
ncbi:MAG: ISAs1 family transposase [Pirellulales bacterium]|nr:ISAs1 family transposase [Pirellulales bacterium]